MGTLPGYPLGNQHPAPHPLQLLRLPSASPPKAPDGGVGLAPSLPYALCSATLEADLLPFPSSFSSPPCWCPRCHLGLETLLHVPGQARVKPGSIDHSARGLPTGAAGVVPGVQAPLVGGDGCCMLGRGQGKGQVQPLHLPAHTHQRERVGLGSRIYQIQHRNRITRSGERGQLAAEQGPPAGHQGQRSLLGHQVWQDRQQSKGTKEGWREEESGEDRTAATRRVERAHDLKSKYLQAPTFPSSPCDLGQVI